jgi:hypothetical protein
MVVLPCFSGLSGLRGVPDYLPAVTNGSDERFPLATFNYQKIIKRKVIRNSLNLQFCLIDSGVPRDIFPIESVDRRAEINKSFWLGSLDNHLN